MSHSSLPSFKLKRPRLLICIISMCVVSTHKRILLQSIVPKCLSWESCEGGLPPQRFFATFHSYGLCFWHFERIPLLWIALFSTFYSSMKWNDVIFHLPLLCEAKWCYFSPFTPLWSRTMLFFTFYSSMKWNDVIFHLSLLYEVKWCYFSFSSLSLLWIMLKPAHFARRTFVKMASALSFREM